MTPQPGSLPGALPGGPPGVELRRVTVEDLPAVVSLLTDDPLGRSREVVDLAPYQRALALIDGDHHQLVVAAVSEGEVVGTLQLTVIPGLSRAGALRGQIEAVRVRADHRGRGTGTALLRWAVDEAARRGCALVQLTTDKSRGDALRLYERLGFVASHEGLKLALGG